MKGCFTFILFVILLFLGPVGILCAAILGILLMTRKNK